MRDKLTSEKTGVIEEGLGLAYGVATRLQRADPDRPMQYKAWVIPPPATTPAWPPL